jgi:hypothetical protein
MKYNVDKKRQMIIFKVTEKEEIQKTGSKKMI